MEEQSTCTLCGSAISAGQAWMESEDSGAHLRAHVECLYREHDGASGSWEPQEHSAP